MKRITQIFIGLILLWGAAACGADPSLPEEASPPEVIFLEVTPAVVHWLPQVAVCAEGIPNFGVQTRVLPRAELSVAESDLILRLGERLDTDPFVAVVGTEEIVIIAGQDVPVTALSLESLQAIYAGEITHWRAVPEYSGDNRLGQAINLLSYPEGHELETIFRRAYLADEPIGGEPQVFLTIEFLENLLESYPGAIGYLLASQVPEGVRVLPVTGEGDLASEQLVLAITSTEPEGNLKQLLLCLQN
jgi:hypothetical protein